MQPHLVPVRSGVWVIIMWCDVMWCEGVFIEKFSLVCNKTITYIIWCVWYGTVRFLRNILMPVQSIRYTYILLYYYLYIYCELCVMCVWDKRSHWWHIMFLQTFKIALHRLSWVWNTIDFWGPDDWLIVIWTHGLCIVYESVNWWDTGI